jgi:hypothetical protein
LLIRSFNPPPELIKGPGGGGPGGGGPGGGGPGGGGPGGGGGTIPEDGGGGGELNIAGDTGI